MLSADEWRRLAVSTCIHSPKVDCAWVVGGERLPASNSWQSCSDYVMMISIRGKPTHCGGANEAGGHEETNRARNRSRAQREHGRAGGNGGRRAGVHQRRIPVLPELHP